MLAHLGLGITVLGIVATSAWRVENILSMKTGETVQFAGYQIAFEKLSDTSRAELPGKSRQLSTEPGRSARSFL